MESVYFRASYWDDNFIDDLTLEANHLYFYILTCRHIQPSGIFKINWNECIFKSKLKTKSKVMKILSKDLKDKVIIHGEWIFVKNFLRKSFNLPSSKLSKNIETAIKNQFNSTMPPMEIIACFYDTYSSLNILYPYPLDTLSQYIKDLGLRTEDLGFRNEEKPTTDNKIFFKDGILNNINSSFIKKCEAAYPAINVNGEIKKAEVWLMANPKNTKSNYERFLTNWFTRSQDRAPRGTSVDGKNNTSSKPEQPERKSYVPKGQGWERPKGK